MLRCCARLQSSIRLGSDRQRNRAAGCFARAPYGHHADLGRRYPLECRARNVDTETTGVDDVVLQVLAECDRPLKRIAIAHRGNLRGGTYLAERIKRLCLSKIG